MKLSVKWLGAVAALALFVVAVAGSSATTSAAEGTIYVSNEGTLRTNESPAPSGGYTYVGSGNSVYSTYVPAGAGTRTIRDDADLVKVVIVDADRQFTSAATASAPTSPITLGAGDSETIVFVGNAGIPIAGDLAFVRENTEVFEDDGAGNKLGDLVAADVLRIDDFYPGTDLNDPWIRVTRITGSGALEIHSVDYLTATAGDLQGGVLGIELIAKSDLDTDGVNLFVTEDGLGTGRFEGYLQLVATDGTSADATSAAEGDAAVLRVGNGPVTIEYEDSDENTRTQQVLVDTSAPSVSFSSPTHESATQNQQPVFSGNINESGSGLNMTRFSQSGEDGLVIHDASPFNPFNTNGTLGTGATIRTDLTKTGSADGDLSFSFSYTPSSLDEEEVRYQVKVSDLAGNLGFSDSDNNSSEGDTAGGLSPVNGVFDSHMVRIDATPPNFSGTATDHRTGLRLDASDLEVADEDRRTLRVRFNEDVQSVDPTVFRVTLDDGSTHVPQSATVLDDAVYLRLADPIPSDDTPTVTLQGGVQDLAGNNRLSGSATVQDGLAPIVTLIVSGGSGTGEGDEGPDKLTNDSITVTVETDENLISPPSVTIHTLDANGLSVSTTSLTVQSQGTRIWEGTHSPSTAGIKAIEVSAIDQSNPSANTQTEGDDLDITFRFDDGLETPTLSPADDSETSLRNPFIRFDYDDAGETSSVTILEVLLNGDDVTDQVVAQSGNTLFFLVPSDDLDLGEHEVSVTAADAAGNDNENNPVEFTFTVVDRAVFELDLFAGWNAVSFPSDPVDPDIDTVFSNTGVDQVVAYNATTPNSPWRIATKDSATGLFSSTTSPALNSINAGPAYWAHTNNFEPQDVELVGRTEPGSGSPPAVITIPTGHGWNFVGVVDQRRDQTEGPSGLDLMRTTIVSGTTTTTVVETQDYFSSVNYQRVYRYDATGLEFVQLPDTEPVDIGEGLWVFVSPQADGSLPAIVP